MSSAAAIEPMAPARRAGTFRSLLQALVHRTMVANKVRLRFAKHGDLRLVSHHDLMRCLERMLRRAHLPMALSQGYNPRPKAVFALALALGIEGRREVLELELAEPMDPIDVQNRLNAEAPPGLEFLEAEGIPAGRAAQAEAVRYAVEIPSERQQATRAALASFQASTTWPYTRHRPDRTVTIDLRPFLVAAEIDPRGVLCFRLKMMPNGSARPEELLEALGLRDLLAQGAVLARTDIELATASVAEAGSSASLAGACDG